MSKKTAIYPGTFDPVTNGHLDIIKRASLLFDEVVVAVAQNDGKVPVFDVDTRVRLFDENVRDMDNVRVCSFNVLTVDLAREFGAVAIIRGLRAVSDFEFEFQMAQMNRFLDCGIETIFLMPSHKYFYTSSTIIKQVCAYEPERIKDFVPDNVLRLLIERSKS